MTEIAASAPLPVSCFGKLPFHREFLRVGLDSPAGAWLVRWVEGAHAAISAGRPEVPEPAPVVRFAAPSPAGRGLVAGIARRSSDGLRRHPIALFTEEPADAGVPPHLLPLALAGVWECLRGLLERAYASPEEFTRALRAGSPRACTEAAAVRYGEALTVSRDCDPWESLTGATGDPARHFALNLLAVGRAQRHARSVEEGVSLVVPLPGVEGDEPAIRAGLWLELLGLASGSMACSLIGLAGGRLYTFHRPVDGADLATMLGVAGAEIDDLSEAWQQLPPADPGLAAALARVGSGGPGPLDEVRSWVRAATAP